MAIARPGRRSWTGPRAQLAALMPYRTAAEVLAQMAPVDAGTAHETLRRYTFRVAEERPIPATVQPATPAETITVTLDSTFIRSCEDGERHLEVRIGNVETLTGSWQVSVWCEPTRTSPR